MLIYDRRRCVPPPATDVRSRLTLPQRARLGQLEAEGWRLLFVRGEASLAFVTHDTLGHVALGRDGRPIPVRSLPGRREDAADREAVERPEPAGESRAARA